MTLQFEGVGFNAGPGGGGKTGTVVLVAMGSQPSTPYTVGSKWFYNGKIYTATTTTATDGGVVPSYDTAYLFNGTYYYWDGSTLQGADESNLVHISGTETITGNKTFSGSVALGDNASAQTKPTSDTSDAVATTQFVKDYAQDGEWQKPAGWIDIQGFPFDNSIYLLVAHSKPTESGGVYSVATYPYLALLARIANAGSFDLFIDGVKIATVADNTTYEIDWASLYTNGTLKGGFDIMHPSELTTHVIRITPTLDTDTINRLYMRKPPSYTGTGNYQTGLLWAHFQIDNAISLDSAFGNETNNTYRCYLLEAITSKNNNLKLSATYFAFRYCTALVKIPELDYDGFSSPTLSGIFANASKIKEIKLKNLTETGVMRSSFTGCTNLKKVVFENSVLKPSNISGVFNNCPNLKELPNELYFDNITQANNALTNLKNLNPIFLDFSLAKDITTLGIHGGDSSNVCNLAGLVVSNEAPFSYETAPQINISYTNMNRAALINLFNSMPTVSDSQEIYITGATGAGDLTAEDIAIATGKGWTVTR